MPGESPKMWPPEPSDGYARIDEIAALERRIARLQAEQAEHIAAHAAETAGSGATGGGRGVAAEVALARGVSTTTAEHQLAAAQTLVDELPLLFELMHRGEISWAGGRAVVRETHGVEPEVRREIDRRLAAAVERSAAELAPASWVGPREGLPPLADDQPPDGTPVTYLRTLTEVVRGQVRCVVLPDVRPRAATVSRLAAAARRLVLLLDAQAAGKRAERARADRSVQLAPTGDSRDGAASLVALLPVEQAAACWHALDHHARARRADGDERSIGQLMADTLVERVTGTAAPVGPLPPAAQIGLLLKATTLAGEDDHPAHLRGVGPIPASVARGLCSTVGSTLRRVIVDDDGRVLTIDRTSRPAGDRSGFDRWLLRPADPSVAATETTDRFFTGPLRTLVGWRDGTCRMPVCDSRAADVDHIRPHAAGGPTGARNGQALSVRCHHLRDLPGWRVEGEASRVVWTTPTGHRYESRPPPALGWASEPP